MVLMFVILQFSRMKNDEYNLFLKDFGKNVRSIRKKQGLTMEAVANEADIEYRQYARIERGEINTSIVTLLRISQVLKIDLFEFFLFIKNETKTYNFNSKQQD